MDAFIYREAIDQELDVEGVLSFAEHVALNAGRLWGELSLDHRQRLQKLIFPEGMSYQGGTFRTAQTALFFNDLSENRERRSSLVSPTGFEPVPPA